MGAGPQPLTHPGRVPAALPWDAAAAASASGLGPLAAWVAGSTGAVPPRVVVRIVVAGGAEPSSAWRDLAPAGRDLPPGAASASTLTDVIRVSGGGAMPGVAHVAAAVDEGRDLAAAAAADGVTVLVAAGAGSDAAARVTDWLQGRDPAIRGPLGALWRLGTRDLAVLCGVALGAGERGLALGSDGPAGIAAACLACAVQPALRPRVRALGGEEPSSDLGLPRVDFEAAAP